MTPEKSIEQITKAFGDYKTYDPEIIDNDTIIKQPNLEEQFIKFKYDW